MVYIGVDSFRWSGNQVVSYNTQWNQHPLSGVAVRFGCIDLFSGTIDRYTNRNGIAGITEREAQDIRCNIDSIIALLVKLNVRDNVPTRGQPTYDYYFQGLSEHNITFPVPAQYANEQPSTKKIGIRPTVQGRVARQGGDPVANRGVCVTYRNTDPANGDYCRGPSAGIALRDSTDGNGRYIIYTSYGDNALNRDNGFRGDTTWLVSGSKWKSTAFEPNGSPLVFNQGPSNTRNANLKCLLADQFYAKASSLVGTIHDKLPGLADRGPCDTFVRRDVLLQVMGAAKMREYGIKYPIGGAQNLMFELERLVSRGLAERIPVNQSEPGDIFYTRATDDSSTGHVGFMESPGHVINAISYPKTGSPQYIVKRRSPYRPHVVYRLCE